jgi:GNAT superfamily N-acetyltransferase
MSETQTQTALEGLAIRTYRPEDHNSVRRLFEIGRLAGHSVPNDTAADLDNIHQTYLNDERVHFWVAEHEGRIVGMVGVTAEGTHMAEVRRLRVDPDFRGRQIAVRLMETVLPFCRMHGYLKVVFDTHMEEDRETREMFDRFAFQHNRTRVVGGKEIQEFYLDLYREPKKEDRS